MRSPKDRRASQRFGRSGERRVELYYKLRGYRLLGRNLRFAGGELDLVLRRGKTIVFVEVKSRDERWSDAAALAVDEAKRARIIAGAKSWYLAAGDSTAGCSFRYDVACVIRGRWFARVIRWKGAFVDENVRKRKEPRMRGS